ncbi:hypothetical protein Pmani_006332 [Petrolisthes manimaculis]|uniref:Uncharacterized protein n=1 Tax=Petrolisthes manimaculis TaxID=1843537 RepID=A0AAE1QAJ2_9EUCA|nr:hypothetical protein Pmani_006332 [Petrolisthes manimaculis]
MYKRRRPGCGAQPAVTTPESATKGRRAEAAEAVRGPPAGVRSASIKNEARAKRRDPPFALVHNTGGPRPDMAHHLVLIDKSRPPKLTHTFSSYLPPPPPPHLPDRRQATPISRTPVLPDPALTQAAHLCACPMVTCHQTILPDSQVVAQGGKERQRKTISTWQPGVVRSPEATSGTGSIHPSLPLSQHTATTLPFLFLYHATDKTHGYPTTLLVRNAVGPDTEYETSRPRWSDS